MKALRHNTLQWVEINETIDRPKYIELIYYQRRVAEG